jgi:hypothetical protein
MIGAEVMEEKREHPRAEMDIDIRFSVLDDEGQRHVIGESRDVSAGGVRLFTHRYMFVGEEVELLIRVGGYPGPLRAAGRVVRVDRLHGGYEIGVKFISSGSQEILSRLIDDHLAALRRD